MTIRYSIAVLILVGATIPAAGQPIPVDFGSPAPQPERPFRPNEILPFPQAAQPITLDDIIALSEVGLAEDLIILHVELQRVSFNLTTQDLLKLRRGQVSNTVIRHLMTQTQKTKIVRELTP